jgi:hypothetical protein
MESFTALRTKYRFHWQTKEEALIKRWDNARHHPEIDTFPHHLHDGADENVIPHKEVSGLEIVRLAVEEIRKSMPSVQT